MTIKGAHANVVGNYSHHLFSLLVRSTKKEIQLSNDCVNIDRL